MSRETATPPPVWNEAHDAYFRIHKRLVGPKTANRLSFLYSELSKQQDSKSMFEAGWAAAEAAIVGEGLNPDDQQYLIEAMKSCWEYALVLERERAASTYRVYETGYTPDRTGELRIATALAAYPVLSELSSGRPSKSAIKLYRSNLADVASIGLQELISSMQDGIEGRVGTYKGIANELIVLMLINRKESTRLLGIPSIARADSGKFYPEQTHDVQIIGMNGDKIVSIVPFEVKSRYRDRFSLRYDAALICGRDHLNIEKPIDVAELLALLIDDTEGSNNNSIDDYLDQKSSIIIHMLRHHKRSKEFGKHCRNTDRCNIPAQRTGT